MKISSLALQLLSTSTIVETNVKIITGVGLFCSLHGTEATLIDGLLRLYRGNGDATDATGNGPALNGEAEYTDVTFPQSGTSRKVFDFQNTQNGLVGSSSGLPAGSNSRSMVGWFKFGVGQLTDGGRVDGDPFGYGRPATNENWYVDIYPTLGNSQYSITVDVDGGNRIIKTYSADPSHTLHSCEGDCDHDGQCSSGTCIQRHSSNDPNPPGCSGTPNQDWDYCIGFETNQRVNPILDTTGTTWFHLVWTYDQPSNTNKVYLNGQLRKTGTPEVAPNTNADAPNASPPSKLFIGHLSYDENSTGLAAYRGQVADIGIFNRVITAEEVTTIYSSDHWFVNAGGGGDPHLVGFGGKSFTWQGVCDVVLLTTAPNQVNKDNELYIQIRTRRVRQWSAIEAVAIKAGGDVAEVESNDGKLFLNGNEVTEINTKTISLNNPTIKRKRVLYNFILDGNKYVEVTANKRSNMIYLSLTGNYPNDTKGVLGSPANPGFFGRDGKAMEGDVNSFVEQWQVNDKDPKLFRTHPYPQFPDKCSYKTKQVKSKSSVKERRLKEKNMIRMEEAIAACASHTSGPLKQFCIEDVFQTGDMEVVDEKFYG